ACAAASTASGSTTTMARAAEGRAADEYSRPKEADGQDAQRHHSRRRLRHAAVPGHHGDLQAAAAGLRQADDLLPADDPDARRHPGRADHLDTGRYATLRRTAGQRQPLGIEPAVRGAALEIGRAHV